jgi:hypothetical protein
MFPDGKCWNIVPNRSAPTSAVSKHYEIGSSFTPNMHRVRDGIGWWGKRVLDLRNALAERFAHGAADATLTSNNTYPSTVLEYYVVLATVGCFMTRLAASRSRPNFSRGFGNSAFSFAKRTRLSSNNKDRRPQAQATNASCVDLVPRSRHQCNDLVVAVSSSVFVASSATASNESMESIVVVRKHGCDSSGFDYYNDQYQ